MNAGSFGEVVASAVPIIRKVVVTSLADKADKHAEIADSSQLVLLRKSSLSEFK